jgi:putative membrane protein
VIFGVVNAIVRPIVSLLSIPLYILTLGLFFFVVNALMLMLTSWIADQVGVPFEVDGFWTAVFGAIVISLASAAIGMLLPEPKG